MIASPTRSNHLFMLIVALCFVVLALDRAGVAPFLRSVTAILYEWLILVSSFALLLGIAHLLLTHLRRIQHGQPEWTYSLFLVIACCAVFVAGLLQPAGVTSPTVEWIFTTLIAPGQAMLYALIFFFMVAAAYHYLRLTTPAGRWMLAGTLVMLIGQMPATNTLLPTIYSEWVGWLLQVPVMATVRGALLGSTLALLFYGVRFLLGRSGA